MPLFNPDGIAVEDEGVAIAGNPHTHVNFVGAGVTASDVAGVATVTIPGGISGIAVEDEGVAIANNPHMTVNFVGAGVTATDVAGVATVTIPGGISGVAVNYVVTGAEADPFIVPIGTVMANANYAILGPSTDSGNITPFVFPNAIGNRTTSQFLASTLVGALTAGQVLTFVVFG